MAVSKVNPRAYKSTNLVFALFTFVLYYNLLSLVQSWIVAERTGFTLSMVALHGGVFVLAGLWLAKNHNNWGWPKVTGRPPTAKHLSESRA
jgi:lipopolysaccharide export system permease protein